MTTRIFCLTLLPIMAHAYGGGRVTVNATPVHVQLLTAAANVGYTISTSNLSPSTADTVLHVQNNDDPNGGFVAGNDDFMGWASQVTLAPAAASRNLVIVVRAYAPASSGTGTLTISGTDGSNRSLPISFGGTPYLIGGGLVQQAHAFTVQQQGGAPDTVILAYSGSDYTHALSYDDDDGLENMSWAHLDNACPTPCTILVGTYPGSAQGSTTLVWDEDIHYNNCDADGLGDGLESALGTNPCVVDSDGDGLSDGLEVIGAVEDPAHGKPAVKLPMYGANPLKKDVFVELDWVECTVANQKCTTDTTPDKFQTPGSVAAGVAAFYTPDVAVHIDNGVTNTDPATWTTWNNWGGATRIPNGTNFCQTLTQARLGMFHHGIISNNSGGGQSDQVGSFCFTAGNSSRGEAIAHELGHGLGLTHGGSIAAGDANCKPHYRSIMNYAYLYDSTVPSFSRNQFSGITLNAVALDEGHGLYSTDKNRVGFLERAPFKLKVDWTTGGVDWNRDGVITPSSTLVRGAPNWADDCEQSIASRNQMWLNSEPSAASWLHTDTGAAWFYYFARQPNGNIAYTHSTSAAGCTANPTHDCLTWTPALSASPLTAPAPASGSSAPTVARYRRTNGGEGLVSIQADASGHLNSETLEVLSSGQEWWTLYTPITTDVITGSPAAAALNDVVYLYGTVGGVIKAWTFQNGTWNPTGTVQTWSDGKNLVSPQGLTVTTGYEAGGSAPSLYMVATDQWGDMNIGRFDAPSGHWIKLPAAAKPPVWSVLRPGLAYVPTSNSNPSVGRFYLLLQKGTAAATLIAMTEGNDSSATATVRRFTWGAPIDVFNIWQVGDEPMSLLYDRDYDQNLRALWSYSGHVQQLAPLADGIVNLPLKDQDDYAVITSHAACSLSRTCH